MEVLKYIILIIGYSHEISENIFLKALSYLLSHGQGSIIK